MKLRLSMAVPVVLLMGVGSPALAFAADPVCAIGDQSVYVSLGTTANAEELWRAPQVAGGNGTFTSVGVGSSHVQYDAIAYRVKDKMIYGFHSETSTDTGVLYQIDPATGTTTLIGTALQGEPGWTFDAATFGSGQTADMMYVLKDTGSTNQFTTDLYTLDFSQLQTTGGAPCSPVSTTCWPATGQLTLDTPVARGADLFYLDGFLWSVYQTDCNGVGTDCYVGVYRIDVLHPAAGVVTVDTFPLLDPGVAPNTVFYSLAQYGFGGQWVYADGSFGIYNYSDDAGVYRFTINDPAGTPTFTPSDGTKDEQPNVPLGHTPAMLDGTSTGVATDLAVTKSVDPTVVLAGGTLDYTVTVTNNGPYDSSGWTLTDVLSPEFTVDTADHGRLRGGRRQDELHRRLAGGR